MPVELKDIKEAMKGAVDEGVKPLVTRLDALDAEGKTTAAGLKALDEKVTAGAEKAEKLAKETVRFDATGKQWAWPEGAEETKAPAFLRGGAGGDSAPFSVVNVLKAIREKNPALAREEMGLSEKFLAAGYVTHDGGCLVPFAPEMIPDAWKGLREEATKRIALPTPDWGELAWMAKRWPSIAKHLGVSQKQLALGDDTLGGYLVPSVQGDRIIDFLRNRSVLARAGATDVALPPNGNITYPRLTGDPTFTWTDPDSTTAASKTNVTLGVVRLQAKPLRGYVGFPNDLLRYSTPSVEMLVRAALGGAAAVKEDQTLLESAGSSFEPKGILNYPQSAANTPTAQKVTLARATTQSTAGDTLVAKDIRNILAYYEMSNDPDAPTAWILRPLVWAGVANTRADAVTAADGLGPFLFLNAADLAGGVAKTMQGIPALTTMQASHNRISSSGVVTDLDYILLGNFRRLLIGRSGAIELAASEHIDFMIDGTVIRAVLRTDGALEHEESFVLVDDLEGF